MWTTVKSNMKIIKTCILYMSMFSLGLGVSLTGPCLLDLERIVGTDTEHIAFVYTSRSVGYLVGAVLSGILLDIIKSRQAVLGLCNFFNAASLLGIPWSRNVETLMGLMVVNGLSLGAIETGGNVVCIQLWGSGALFQAFHFTFGLGGLISPLIAAPFLSYHRDLEDITDNATYLANLDFNASSNLTEDTIFEGVASITYPFSIVGVFGLLVAALFFAVCLVSPTEEGGSQSDEVKKSKRSCLSMFGALLLTFLIFFVDVGMEIGYGQMLTTYAVKGKLKTTTTIGSYMTSVYWTAFTISRLLCVFLSMKMNNLTLFICDISIVAVSGLLLLFFMPHEWTLWTASVVFGTGIASTYGALVGWVDNYIIITNKISSIFTVGCAAGEMVVPFLIAYFMEIVPEMFVYVILASCVIIMVLLLGLYAVFTQSERKPLLKKTECYVISNETVKC